MSPIAEEFLDGLHLRHSRLRRCRPRRHTPLRTVSKGRIDGDSVVPISKPALGLKGTSETA